MLNRHVFKELQNIVFELTLALYRVTDFFPKEESLRQQLRQRGGEILEGIYEYDISSDKKRDIAVLLKKIRVMQRYLEIARSMRFVRPINLMVLEREYSALEDFFRTEFEYIRQLSNMSYVNNKRHNYIKGHYISHFFGHNGFDKIPEEKEQTDPVVKKDKYRPPHTIGEQQDADAPIHPVVSKEKIPGSAIQNNTVTERQQKILEYIKVKNEAKISDFFDFFQGISSKTIQRDLQDLVDKSILKKEGERRWTVYKIN